jgi:hypothetical protein
MTVAGSIWAAAAWQAESSQPAFVLLEPSEPGQSPSPPAGSDTMAAQTGAPRPDDTLRVALAPAPVAPAPPPDSLRRRRPRRDTAAAAVPAVTAPRRDTATAASAPVQVQVAAPVQPPPPPTPQPEPERREPAAAAVPDEAALRRAADAELQRGIARFVAAVTARQVGTVATLYPAGGDNRRIKFLDYLRESEPEVSLRMTEAAAVSETSAQANFTLTFRWRAEFGVARRKDARFVATARRTGDGWAFESARLLENMP